MKKQMADKKKSKVGGLRDPPGGRPKIKAGWDKIQKEINLNQVIYWIGLQATAEEIAGAFRVDFDTLNARIKEEFGCGFSELKKLLGNGADAKIALRRNQFKLSESNASMAIWLGKQWLEQKDHDRHTAEAVSQAASDIIGAADKLAEFNDDTSS